MRVVLICLCMFPCSYMETCVIPFIGVAVFVFHPPQHKQALGACIVCVCQSVCVSASRSVRVRACLQHAHTGEGIVFQIHLVGARPPRTCCLQSCPTRLCFRGVECCGMTAPRGDHVWKIRTFRGAFCRTLACRRAWRMENRVGVQGASFDDTLCNRHSSSRQYRLCRPWILAAIGGFGLMGGTAMRGAARAATIGLLDVGLDKRVLYCSISSVPHPWPLPAPLGDIQPRPFATRSPTLVDVAPHLVDIISHFCGAFLDSPVSWPRRHTQR